ncbi:MAG: hypothetical protein J6J63_05930 [Oscillospiraceae bacterium]|nr:hypothetical protein [Oscillospiraceae bacterium]
MKFTWNLQLFASEDAEHPAMPEDTGETALDAGEQESFESLIRGQYKAEFDARVQKILDGRLRGLRQENEQLRREKTARKESARQVFSRLSEEEAAVQAVYPTFQWRKEIQNPTFGRLVASGIDARTAYEVVHREEVLRQAMSYAAKRAKEQTSRAIASGALRVRENGGRNVTVTRNDPKGLSSEDLANIRKRVFDGEKIRF